jgi:hypothetical protein
MSVPLSLYKKYIEILVKALKLSAVLGDTVRIIHRVCRQNPPQPQHLDSIMLVTTRMIEVRILLIAAVQNAMLFL